MSEFSPAPQPAQPVRKRGSGVAVAVIVAGTIVSLACIGAFTLVLYVLLQNPPW